jgi:Zn-dependent protease with chaperone function
VQQYSIVGRARCFWRALKLILPATVLAIVLALGWPGAVPALAETAPQSWTLAALLIGYMLIVLPLRIGPMRHVMGMEWRQIASRLAHSEWVVLAVLAFAALVGPSLLSAHGAVAWWLIAAIGGPAEWLWLQLQQTPPGASQLPDTARAVHLREWTQRWGIPLDVRVVGSDPHTINARAGGPSRRPKVWLWPKLLETLDRGEVDAVMAHEIGHIRLGHFAQRFVLQCGVWLLCAGVAVLLWPLLQASSSTPQAAMPMLLLIVAITRLLATPLLAAQQRRFEYEADTFASEHSKAHDLARALRKLQPDPGRSHALYARFWNSHPDMQDRLRAIEHSVTNS